MITDIIQDLIYKCTEHFSCYNCELSYCMNYTNNCKICSGIVKQVNPEIPYDVIRLCIKTTSEEIQTYDYTPDESQSILIVLLHSTSEWMQEAKSYQKFRSPEV